MLICIIDKAPSRVNYSTYFKFEFELFHMSSVPITKLLKKDVTLDIDTSLYDFVILVGSEAAKEYAKVSVTNYAGQLIENKFIPISSPAALSFKPEGKPAFERAVDRIHKYVDGTIKPATVGDYKGISSTKEAKEYLNEIMENACGVVAWDTETTALYPRDGYVLGVSLTYTDKQGRYILTDCLDEECMQILQDIADNNEAVFHNMKFDFKMIAYHLDIKFTRTRVHDTMLMHYVLDENDSHGLKPLALKYTDFGDYDSELDDFKKSYCAAHDTMLQEDFTYDLIPFDIISKYAAIDTAVTYELFNKFWPIIQKNDKLRFVYEKLLLEGTLFLMDMEEVGIPISKERMSAAFNYLSEEIMQAKEIVYAFDEVKRFEKDTGKIFNPNSVMQLRAVLFDYLGLSPTGKRTKTGAVSTDAEVLQELSEEHPLPAAILTVRQLSKMQNTYISKILPELDKDGRIRTNFNLIFTTSGRLSSSGKFNAQQIVRDNPIIKGCIKAPSGYKIVSQDLKTGEVYYAAVLSGDKNLQAVFTSGGDFHSTIAKSVFDLPCPVEDVKRLFGDSRQAAKAITFSILYGAGPSKVADTVSKETGTEYSLSRATEDISSYYAKFSKLKAWLKSRKEFIEANGYTYSFLGRKRRLPNVFSSDKGIASHEVRSGINMEVQSLCSDINLLAAMDTTKELRLKGLDAHICMLVHDSIVAIVKEADVEEYCEIVRRNTQKTRGCSIQGCPIGVDQEIGDDYAFGKFEKWYSEEEGTLRRILT